MCWRVCIDTSPRCKGLLFYRDTALYVLRGALYVLNRALNVLNRALYQHYLHFTTRMSWTEPYMSWQDVLCNTIFTFYYTCVRPQCDFSILGRIVNVLTTQDTRNCTQAVHERVNSRILELPGSLSIFTEITGHKYFSLLWPRHELIYKSE